MRSRLVPKTKVLNIFNVKKESMYVFFHCFNSEYAKKLVGEFEAEFIYNLVKKND